MMQAEKGMGEVYYVHCDLREEKEIEVQTDQKFDLMSRVYDPCCFI